MQTVALNVGLPGTDRLSLTGFSFAVLVRGLVEQFADDLRL